MRNIVFMAKNLMFQMITVVFAGGDFGARIGRVGEECAELSTEAAEAVHVGGAGPVSGGRWRLSRGGVQLLTHRFQPVDYGSGDGCKPFAGPGNYGFQGRNLTIIEREFQGIGFDEFDEADQVFVAAGEQGFQ